MKNLFKAEKAQLRADKKAAKSAKNYKLVDIFDQKLKDLKRTAHYELQKQQGLFEHKFAKELLQCSKEQRAKLMLICEQNPQAWDFSQILKLSNPLALEIIEFFGNGDNYDFIIAYNIPREKWGLLKSLSWGERNLIFRFGYDTEWITKWKVDVIYKLQPGLSMYEEASYHAENKEIMIDFINQRNPTVENCREEYFYYLNPTVSGNKKVFDLINQRLSVSKTYFELIEMQLINTKFSLVELIDLWVKWEGERFSLSIETELILGRNKAKGLSFIQAICDLDNIDNKKIDLINAAKRASVKGQPIPKKTLLSLVKEISFIGSESIRLDGKPSGMYLPKDYKFNVIEAKPLADNNIFTNAEKAAIKAYAHPEMFKIGFVTRDGRIAFNKEFLGILPQTNGVSIQERILALDLFFYTGSDIYLSTAGILVNHDEYDCKSVDIENIDNKNPLFGLCELIFPLEEEFHFDAADESSEWYQETLKKVLKKYLLKVKAFYADLNILLLTKEVINTN